MCPYCNPIINEVQIVRYFIIVVVVVAVELGKPLFIIKLMVFVVCN